ncbi:TPA: hypothetical protein ACOAY7_002859 [Vibrio cholerae]|uniref:hypothetical protein n=1 Tax=Vibrio cholerae TaxID=666 RepID=UPI00204B8F50|nr:hypothetical protein 2017DRC106_0845 [Vibrio phage ICP1]QVV97797.1 hypothetical protein 2017DRC32_0845 [Vibrio phage ICP1]QVV98024.1 hypothetical protein 2017DRC48_0845 [Vibrio phage ICP1]QVV98251.1 hypothetical protein 2017DRC55_0845 [Vibrio phage ICP1]QVV98477.1 hypothetical protein 2017DRC72_0840 [Vibrio phage ICP1]
MINTKAIFISAQQPRSGKDLSAKYLQSFFTDLGYNCEIHAFKDKLIEHTADFVGVTVEKFMEHYDDKVVSLTYAQTVDIFRPHPKPQNHAWVKDVPMYEVDGNVYSKRQALIHVSEDIYKPIHGKDYFGQAVAKLIDNQDIIIYSDSGFAHEAFPVIEKVGKDNCLVVQLIRQGYDSGIKDSRKLLEPDDFPEHLRPRFVRVSNPNCEDWEGILEDNLRLKVANKVLEGM